MNPAVLDPQKSSSHKYGKRSITQYTVHRVREQVYTPFCQTVVRSQRQTLFLCSPTNARLGRLSLQLFPRVLHTNLDPTQLLDSAEHLPDLFPPEYLQNPAAPSFLGNTLQPGKQQLTAEGGERAWEFPHRPPPRVHAALTRLRRRRGAGWEALQARCRQTCGGT